MRRDRDKVVWGKWIPVVILIVCIVMILYIIFCFLRKEEVSNSVNSKHQVHETTIDSMPLEESTSLHLFTLDEVTYTPEISDYSSMDLVDIPTETIYENGIFAGSPCSWQAFEENGIYYMFAVFEEQEIGFTQYVILSDEYTAPCGIKVGMSEDEVLNLYPNISVVNFDGEWIAGYNSSLGFNGSGFPREYDIDGKRFNWYEQYDHCMLAEVETGEEMPYYMVMFVKDNKIMGICFEYPTAG
ncbi:MAG TPA: hypothetical protein VJY54_08530 [Lachnospiraceae bacterium]|nr:hypothetical protein [Lachnospiraceae bacterium]